MAVDIKVMIVDDNQYVRDAVEILFQSKGGTVVAASGGEECLSFLEAGFRGILLMDVMMPDLDGWDTIRQIVDRGVYDGNIILMLTGKGELDGKVDGIQEFITDYITKPFTPDHLVATVEYYASLLGTALCDHASP